MTKKDIADYSIQDLCDCVTDSIDLAEESAEGLLTCEVIFYVSFLGVAQFLNKLAQVVTNKEEFSKKMDQFCSDAEKFLDKLNESKDEFEIEQSH